MKNLILLHGALGAKTELLPLAKALRHEFQVHILEFEGHGETPFKVGFSIPSFASNLKAFILEHELEGADVFGYSMGGYVALYLAAEQPGLLGRIITLGTKFHWTPETASREVRMLNPEKIEEKVPKFAVYLAQLHGNDTWKTQMLRTAQLMLDLGNNDLLQNRFAQVSNKCYIMLGDSDDMVTKEETENAVSSIPDATFHLLDNTAHPIARVSVDTLALKIRSLLV
jgi:pimeloyl-ACP methyl ester carboxylesterase